MRTMASIALGSRQVGTSTGPIPLRQISPPHRLATTAPPIGHKWRALIAHKWRVHDTC